MSALTKRGEGYKTMNDDHKGDDLKIDVKDGNAAAVAKGKKKKKAIDKEEEKERAQFTPQRFLLEAAKKGDLEEIRKWSKEAEVTCQLGEHYDVNARRYVTGPLDAPLHLAAENGHVEAIDLLVQLEANIEQRNRNGSTPLHIGAAQGNAAVVEKLLSLKADIHAKNHIGNYPLHCASFVGSTDACKLLLEHSGHGAQKDLELENRATMSSEDYAHDLDVQALLKTFKKDQGGYPKIIEEDSDEEEDDLKKAPAVDEADVKPKIVDADKDNSDEKTKDADDGDDDDDEDDEEDDNDGDKDLS